MYVHTYPSLVCVVCATCSTCYVFGRPPPRLGGRWAASMKGTEFRDLAPHFSQASPFSAHLSHNHPSFTVLSSGHTYHKLRSRLSRDVGILEIYSDMGAEIYCVDSMDEGRNGANPLHR